MNFKSPGKSCNPSPSSQESLNTACAPRTETQRWMLQCCPPPPQAPRLVPGLISRANMNDDESRTTPTHTVLGKLRKRDGHLSSNVFFNGTVPNVSRVCNTSFSLPTKVISFYTKYFHFSINTSYPSWSLPLINNIFPSESLFYS